MKYIDADKLKKSIGNYMEGAHAALNPTDGDADYYKGKIDACKDMQEFITSLQQEQPKFKIGDTIHKIGENTVFPMTIERISDGDYVCDGGKCFVSIKFQDDYELVEQEQPDFDDVDPKHLVHSHYTKVRETKTGRVFWAEYSSEAAEWYEAGTGKAYSISKVEIVEEQPESELEKAARYVYESWMGGTMDDVRRDMVKLGKVLNARKEE